MSKNNIPCNYSEAETFLNGRDSRKVKSIRATGIHRIGEDKIAMYYHLTPVVIWEKDGTVNLTSGGHHSLTTKKRINQGIKGSGYTLFQEKFQWYLHQADGETHIPFYNGMKV